MKSALYAAKRIDDSEGKPIAIVVVEAIESDRFEEATIKPKLERQENYLAKIINTLYEHIPSVNQARARGF